MNLYNSFMVKPIEKSIQKNPVWDLPYSIQIYIKHIYYTHYNTILNTHADIVVVIDR